MLVGGCRGGSALGSSSSVDTTALVCLGISHVDSPLMAWQDSGCIVLGAVRIYSAVVFLPRHILYSNDMRG